MADLISISFVILFFLLGLNFPKKAGWTALFIGPLLGPTSLTVAGSTFLPLTVYRIVFAITIGLLISRYGRNYPISRIFKSNFVKILFLFALMVLMVSFQDRAKNMVFSFIPNIFCAITLCFILINDRDDLMRFIKIFVIHASIISLFILVEFYSDFNLTFFLQQSVPGVEADELGVTSKVLNPQDRSGLYRPGGLDGNAAATGFRLVVLFPIALWYIVRGNIISILPSLLTLIAIVHLQTRASWLAIGVSILFLCLVFFQNYERKLKKIMFIGLLFFTFSLALFFLIQPKYFHLIKLYMSTTLISSFDLTSNNSFAEKWDRLPFAFNIIFSKPLFGYMVSRYYAEGYMFFGLDLPSPLVYMISGGIVLTSIYLLHLFFMPISMYAMSKRSKYHINEKLFLLFAASGLFAGIFCVFTNYQETHLLIMYMIYISCYKVYNFYDNQQRVVK